jgi:hypothetical protein
LEIIANGKTKDHRLSSISEIAKDYGTTEREFFVD